MEKFIFLKLKKKFSRVGVGPQPPNVCHILVTQFASDLTSFQVADTPLHCTCTHFHA